MRLRVLLTAGFVLAASSAVAKDPAMRSVMADHVNPAALAFWAGGNDPPEGETAAAAKIRWAEAVKGAQAMQRWGMLMKEAPYARSGHWNDYAQMMIDVSREGEAAARAEDATKAFDIGGRLYDACNGCHKTYVPRRDAPA